MGLLAPLYLVGLFAIGVPIVLHLIRRTPQGRQMFSSLMFLQPSPPRLTRRSRLTNILLLLLRALAVILLALAFMRPFFNWRAVADTQGTTGRRIAILVDRSASMRRGDLWDQAKKQVVATLDDVSPMDEVGLYFFDTEVRPGFTFNEWNDASPADRIPLLESRLKDASPGWGGTRMGDAMSAMVDAVSQSDGKITDTRKIDRHIVLISDMQEGSHIETLQGREWPKDVYYIAKPVTAAPGNATLQWIAPTSGEKADGTVRVKVTNEPDPNAKAEQFTLTWADEKGPIAGVEPLKVYAAVGQSRIVKMAWPGGTAPATQPGKIFLDGKWVDMNSLAKADRIILSGDQWDFDNTLYLAQPRVEDIKVLYIGPDSAKDFNGMRYYLESALTDTARRHVEIVGKKASEELTDADLAGVRLVVVGAIADRPQGTDDGEVTPDAADRLHKFVNDGGDVLWVVRDVPSGKPLSHLLNEELPMDEETGGFALISRIDVSHPLFAPFSDVRFGDFTQIHFWRWRKVDLKDSTGVLASFDSGSPFIFERFIGQGRVRVMTSGWNPSDSQLALDAAKFVPLVERMLQRRDEVTVEAQYMVNESIAVPEAGTAERVMILPSGKEVPLAAAATFTGADAPGIYRLRVNGTETPIAVNVAPDESRTAPMPSDEPEKWGARMAKPENAADVAVQEQHKRSAELENRQKLWRWLIVIVLGLLGVETVLAGLQARRSLAKEQAVL